MTQPIKTSRTNAEDAFMELEKTMRESLRGCDVSHAVVSEWSKENKVFVLQVRFPYVSDT